MQLKYWARLLIVFLVVILQAELAHASITSNANKIANFSYGAGQIASVVSWLKQNAIPLNGVDPGLPNNDLADLETVFKDVQLVGVGEATHGTSDFFRFKHRLFRFLVEKNAFTVLALEADWCNCKLLDDYISTGNGDPEKLLGSSNYPHWRRLEVLDVIKWMRNYNSQLPVNNYDRHRLKLVGLEQTQSYAAEKLLEAKTQNLNPELLEKVKDIRQLIASGFAERIKHHDKKMLAIRSKILQQIATLKNSIHSSTVIDNRTKNELAWYLQIIQNGVKVQFELDFTAAGNYRDKAMSETITEILKVHGPNTKIMVWASNGHIHPKASSSGWISAGTHLKKTFGTKYYAIAQCFLEGSFLAQNQDEQGEQPRNVLKFTEFNVLPPKTQTLETLFAKAFAQPFFIDYRQAKNNKEIQAWLRKKQPMRQCATSFSRLNEERFIGFVTPGDFDGMVFIPKTLAAAPLADADKD